MFLFESFAQTKWAKNHLFVVENDPKRVNGGKLCIFAFKNPNLAQLEQFFFMLHTTQGYCTLNQIKFANLGTISIFDICEFYNLETKTVSPSTSTSTILIKDP